MLVIKIIHVLFVYKNDTMLGNYCQYLNNDLTTLILYAEFLNGIIEKILQFSFFKINKKVKFLILLNKTIIIKT